MILCKFPTKMKDQKRSSRFGIFEMRGCVFELIDHMFLQGLVSKLVLGLFVSTVMAVDCLKVGV